MRILRNLAVAGLAASMLSGCVVAIGNDRPSGESDWVQVERDNRAAIDNLQLGMSVDEVRSRMPHEPAFSEAFAASTTFRIGCCSIAPIGSRPTA